MDLKALVHEVKAVCNLQTHKPELTDDRNKVSPLVLSFPVIVSLSGNIPVLDFIRARRSAVDDSM